MRHPIHAKTVPIAARLISQIARIITGCAILLAQLPQQAQAGTHQVVHGAVPAAVATAPIVKHTLSMQKLNLSISLPMRNQGELQTLLQDIYTPGSPNYRHYLTPAQFADRFGPSEKDYQEVINWAKTHGLAVTGTVPTRMVLTVQGPVVAVEKALQISLDEYQHPTENRTFRAPNTEPTIDVSALILAIGGLDTFTVPKACARLVTEKELEQQRASGHAPATGSGTSGAYEAKDFRAAYLPGTTLTGAGQNLGLIEFDGSYFPNDILTFEEKTGAPNVPVIPVYTDGFGGGLGGSGTVSEVCLDIEMAIGMAPGLNSVVVYEGETPDGILGAMAAQNTCKQLSASYTYGTDAGTDPIFMEMAAQGQTFFNASGDADAYVGPPLSPNGDPWITSVGGTEITTTGALGSWTGETVWNDSTTAPQGGGGGISTTELIPTWQQGISMAGNGGSTSLRNIPDVASCAYNVFVYYYHTSGAFVGTSCATPTWAAVIACANQLAAQNGEPSVGFMNPLIYSIGKGQNGLSYVGGFHDITSGNIEWTDSPSKYAAATGYDLCTGWGSPAGTNLLVALGLSEPLRISPWGASYSFSGTAGGPFLPATQSLTLSNGASGTINWSISSIPSWLDVSVSSGSLTEGGTPASIALSIDPSATNLADGTYSTSLTVTDTSDGYVQSVPVTLGVVTSFTISSSPVTDDVPPGGTATFSVGITPSEFAYYQWQSNGVNVSPTGSNYSGVNSSTLYVSNATTPSTATYTCIVSNAAGSFTSGSAGLISIPSMPSIVSGPTSVAALPGQWLELSVAVTGTTPITYTWFSNGVKIVNGGEYGQAASNTLVITNVFASNAVSYTVGVTNSMGGVLSTPAVVSLPTITAPGIGVSLAGSFPVSPSSAAEVPYNSVVYDSAAAAYFGTTFDGGSDGVGAAFKMTTAGAFTTEHSFTGGTDGALPVAGLCLGSDGNFYGATYQYGTYSDGAIWKMTTSGTLTALVQFNGDNGSEPVSTLMQAKDGNLYGAANAGGDYNLGTLFRCSTSGTLTVLMSFDGFEGAFPSPALVQATDGALYGTTESGGTNDAAAGTIFRITTNGFFTLLYSFTGGADGSAPIAGLIQGVDGNFYGVTINGGTSGQGTIFKMTPSGSLTTLYSFTGGSDGAEPWGGLMQASDGNLYGTCQQGGTYAVGTVFRIAPTGDNFTTLVECSPYDISTPEAPLIQGPDGNLYGTSWSGGTLLEGSVFKVTINSAFPLAITGQPANVTTYVGTNAVFAVATAGGPVTSYQWYSNNVILNNGVGVSGATSSTLTLSGVTTASSASYDVVVNTSSNSLTSSAAILNVLQAGPTIVIPPASQTALVGSLAIFSVVATGDAPMTYQWTSNGVNLTDNGTFIGSLSNILQITNVSLASSASYAVIVGNDGGPVTSAPAILMVVSAAGPGLTASTLHSFAGGTADGIGPEASLMQAADGNLYGTFSSGGASFYGGFFKTTTSGAYTLVTSFNGTSAAYPEGGLVQAANGDLYGLASAGGTDGVGAFYQIASYTTFTYPHTFTGITTTSYDAASPDDSLFLSSSGNLYGTSSAGSFYNEGTVFQITTAGTVTIIYNFTNGVDGSAPYAGVVQGPDGLLYGTAPSGGADDLGTVYKVTTSGALKVLATFDGGNGSDPVAGLLLGQDGYYYGCTAQGGLYDNGTVFKISSSGALTTVFNFDGTNGSFPTATLIQLPTGQLVGTAQGGGLGDQGIVFLLNTNGSFSTLLNFDGFNGSEPQSPVLKANDGNLYGVAAFGGVGYDVTLPETLGGSGDGVLYKIVLPTLISGPFSAGNGVACLPYSSTLSGTNTPAVGDTYSYSLISGPAWLSVASDGALSGSPANVNIGANNFVIGVSNASGFFASTNLTISVVTNPPPTFTVSPITESAWANAGVAYSGSIAADATAPYLGEGDALTFGLISGPAWLSVSPSGVLSGTPADADGGFDSFTVGVTNLCGDFATNTVSIYVNPHPVWSASTLDYPSAVAGLAYSGSTLATNASDISTAYGDYLTFSLLSGPPWLTIATNGAISGTPTTNDIGTDDFTVEVSDTNGLFATATLQILVNSNVPPYFVVNPLAGPNATPGTAYSLIISTNAVDVNPGDTLTFGLFSGPGWATVSPSGVLSGTPSGANSGTNTFVVSATDLAGATGYGTVVVDVFQLTPITLSIVPMTGSTNYCLQWTGGLPPYEVLSATTFPPTWVTIYGPTSATNLLVVPTNSATFYQVEGQ